MIRLFSIYLFWVVFVSLIFLINLYSFLNRSYIHQHFIDSDLKKAAIMAHQAFLSDHNRLLAQYQTFLSHKPLNGLVLKNISKNEFNTSVMFNPYSRIDWQDMINGIDVVPLKVVLAQADHYSRDGTSLLAKKGNNLFQMLEDKAENGISDIQVPGELQQINWLTPGDVQYANYFAIQRGISDYMWLINTAKQYDTFRRQRAERRRSGRSLLDWYSPNLLKLTQTSKLATDSLYGASQLPVLPFGY